MVGRAGASTRKRHVLTASTIFLQQMPYVEVDRAPAIVLPERECAMKTMCARPVPPEIIVVPEVY
jgi:hypothetical protein